MTDLVTFGETMIRLSPPEGTRLRTADSFEARVGGSESNVAVAGASLGLETAWLSKLPDSPLGDRVVRELRGHGVEPRAARGDGGRLGTYYLEHGGAPRGTNVIYDRADSAVTTVSPDELPLGVLDGAEAFHTSGITPALSPDAAETTATLLERAADAGVRTSFDVNYRSKLWSPGDAHEGMVDLLEHVDTLFVARRDAETVFGREADPESIARSMADEHGIGTVVVTRGERGSLAYRDGETYEQPVYESETLDAIGTGDAFVGGFLSRRLLGGDVEEALAWGAATAALKRTISGDAVVVSPAEVERVIAEESVDISR